MIGTSAAHCQMVKGIVIIQHTATCIIAVSIAIHTSRNKCYTSSELVSLPTAARGPRGKHWPWRGLGDDMIGRRSRATRRALRHTR